VGITLHVNTLVLVDEAHNLPTAVSQIASASLSQRTAERASDQLTTYLERYLGRLSSHHLQLLGQLKVLLRGIIHSMTNNRTNRTAGTAGDHDHTQRVLMSSSQFLVAQKLETINLFPILRYLDETKLSQKLLGFLPKQDDDDDDDGDDGKDKDSGKENTHNTTTKATTNTTTTSTSAPPSTSKHISPMSVVETFLQKLTFSNDDDGQVVIDYANGRIEFVVLNPAVHAADDLWTRPRAVCLVGGTLQPIDVMIQELTPALTPHAVQAQASWQRQRQLQQQQQQQQLQLQPGGRGGPFTPTSHRLYQSDPLWAFTCGHVVDSSHVLLQALTAVGGTPIDVRHATRSTREVCTAIGTAIVQLCRRVPHGVVVFLPSYRYEQILVDSWKTSAGGPTSIWKQLHDVTTVIREPREASQVEPTLARYGEAATKKPSTGGALLLSVVGGKLSEGINFADDLCRCVCVVGLPYADRSDPLLREKLKLSSNPQHYYRSLCLRAVNQSVGRAIRHAHDYAAVVMMDVRYKSDDAVARGLPSWLTDSTPTWRSQRTDLDAVLGRIDAFFDGRKERNASKSSTSPC
jgi:chromosome transmission fidelity protein 1